LPHTDRQIHPWLCREDLVQFCRAHDIRIEAYSPLTRGIKLQDEALVAVAGKYGRSTAQVLIRWGMQRGYVTLPKSEKQARIVQNADVFSWEISEEDMKALNALDSYFVTGMCCAAVGRWMD
jgi:methylglyoxal/glyoxal reductase